MPEIKTFTRPQVFAALREIVRSLSAAWDLLREHAPIRFDLIAVNLDQKHPGFPAHVLPEYLASREVEYRIIEQDTYSVVKRVIPEGKTMCGLCSRMRRGALRRSARCARKRYGWWWKCRDEKFPRIAPAYSVGRARR